MKKILGVILGAGFIFRMLYLAKRQLATEELMQALVARSDSVAAMLHRFRGGMYLPTPLDYLVQKGFVSFLGESAWSLRLHAVVFGTLSIWIFARIARRLFGDRVALYCTALFAVFPLHYHFSQNGEPFALFSFLTLLSFDLLLRVVSNQEGGWRGWLSLGGSLVLLLYASFIGPAVLFTQFICLVLVAANGPRLAIPSQDELPTQVDLPAVLWKNVLLYALCAAVAAALFLPWALFFWTRPSLASVGDLLTLKTLLRLVKEIGDNSYLSTAVLAAGVAIGYRALIQHKRRIILLWLISWFAVSIPAVLLTDILAGYYFGIGHILHATPALVLLAGYGLYHLGERLIILDELPIQISSPAICYAILLAALSAFIARGHWKRESVDWVGASRYVQDKLRPGDLLTVPQGFALLEYYSPGLTAFRSTDLSAAGPVSEQPGNRFVVCLEASGRDPCGDFRKDATKDRGWSKQDFRGIDVFARQK